MMRSKAGPWNESHAAVCRPQPGCYYAEYDVVAGSETPSHCDIP
jgi:hypothetical protein